MTLWELFEGTGSGDMMVGLRQQVIDYLIPMVSHEVEYVALPDIEAMLRDTRSGLTIDRGLVMQILDPTKLKMVKKIEGDKIYLSVTAAMTPDKSDEEQAKAADSLNQKATQQAVKSIKDK